VFRSTNIFLVNIKQYSTRIKFLFPIALVILSWLISFLNSSKTQVWYLSFFPISLPILEFIGLFASILFFYLLCALITDKKDVFFILNLTLYSALFLVIYCIFQVVFPVSILIPYYLNHTAFFHPDGLRAGGNFGYELASEFFAVLIIVSVYFYARLKQIKYFLVALLLIMGLVLTGTRGGFFVLILGFVLLLIFSKRMKLEIWKLFMAYIGIFVFFIVVTLCVSSLFGVPSLIERTYITVVQSVDLVNNYVSNKDVQKTAIDPTSRLRVWNDTYYKIIQTFRKTGNQTTHFVENFDYLAIFVGRSFYLNPIVYEGKYVGYEHGLHLHILLMFGTFGLLSFIILIGSMFIHLLKERKYLLLIVLSMILTDQLKYSFLIDYQYSQFVWLIFAIIALDFKI
jgi:O-antigen ligase